MLIIDKTMDPETNVDENFDSTNEELEVENNESDEHEEENEEVQDDSKKRVSSHIDRLKKERDELKERLATLEKQGSPKETPVADTSRLEKMELTVGGVKHKDDQEFVLEYARNNGMNVLEALETGFVQRGLQINKQERAEKNSSQTPTNRTAGGSQDAMLRKAINHYKQTGEVLDGLDVPTTRKLMAHLKAN